jgi:hypothetical protein
MRHVRKAKRAAAHFRELHMLTDDLTPPHWGETPEQIVARLTAALEVSQRNNRDTFDAMCAMRNAINERIPMASLESDLLQGPENSVFCATVAEAVVSHIDKLTAALATARAETAMAYAAAAERAARRWAIRKEHADKLYEMDYPEAAIDSRTVSAKADEAESIAEEIRALAPAHATEALAAYRKAVRVQALREAMAACLDRDDRAFILALIEKEG